MQLYLDVIWIIAQENHVQLQAQSHRKKSEGGVRAKKAYLI